MSTAPRLVWLGSAAVPIQLDPQTPLTIGRDPGNGLSLPQERGLSRRHAEVRLEGGSARWLVCDLGSSNGTYLGGERLVGCQPLADGDQIRLGRQGPVLVFQSQPVATGSGLAKKGKRPAQATPAAVPAAPAATLEGSVTVGDLSIPLAQIRAVSLRREPRHPHSFSWWVLACLSGLLLLPFRPLFLLVEITALAVWIALSRRHEHILTLTLRDGLAHRHGFRDPHTALAHRNGIRRALGQPVEP
jgi:pSer/pThr/pTyr-binding forkhead associated (FHA) protein